MTAYATARGRFETISQMLRNRFPLWGDSFDAWKTDLQRLSVGQYRRGMKYLKAEIAKPGDIYPSQELFMRRARESAEEHHRNNEHAATKERERHLRRAPKADHNLALNVLGDLRADLKATQNRHREERRTHDKPGTPTIAQHLARDRSAANQRG